MKHLNRRTVIRTLGASSLAWAPPSHLWAKPSDEKPLLRFGLIADVQYVDAKPRNSRHYQESLPKLEAAIEHFNSIDDLAFVSHLGDTIDRDFESIAKVMPIFERLHAPFHQVLGNHDFDVEANLKADVPASLGMAERFSSFAIAGFRFIIVDGNADSIYAGSEPEASRERLKALEDSGLPQAHEWNGGLGESQMTWLEAQLDAAKEANEEVILFCHFPAYPADNHNLWDSEEIVQMLSTHDARIRAWFNGHNHAGNYGESAGIHFLTLRGVVETPDTNAFSTVSVFADRLEIDGFDRENDRVLQLKV